MELKNNEFTVKFKPEPKQGFYHSLKKDATKIISNEDKYASKSVWIKAFIFLLILVVSGVNISTGAGPILLWYLLIGICMHVLTLHVVHDAAHGVLSKYRTINYLALFMMDLMGADGRIWRRRHIYGHHPFPNILGKDVDIGQSKVVVIFPGMQMKWIHKFQHLYMPFVYPLYSLYWFFIRDLQNLFALEGKPVFTKKPSVFGVLGFMMVKVFALSWQVFLPLIIFPEKSWLIIFGFLLMHFTASILGAFVLLSSHVDGKSDFTQPDEDGNMPFTWAEHQVVSNADFSTQSTFWTIFFGGFNHHIAHHLFPYISKSRLAPITPLIQQKCREYGIEYREMPFGAGLISHIQFLKRS